MTKVYFRRLDRNLGCIEAGTDNHADAIEAVKELLLKRRVPFIGPVLAVINK